MTTLADKILSLNDGKRSTRDIAEAVYRREVGDKELAYVRIVLRQRKGSKCSETDFRYVRSSLGREKGKRDAAYNTAMRNTGDRAKARIAFRRAYRSARKAGASPREATNAGATAWMRAIRQTGDRKAARIAYHAAQGNADRTNAGESASHA